MVTTWYGTVHLLRHVSPYLLGTCVRIKPHHCHLHVSIWTQHHLGCPTHHRVHIANITSNCNCAFLITYSRAVARINVLCFVIWLKVDNMVSVKSLVYNSLTFPLNTNLRISIHFTAVSKTFAKYPTCFLGLYLFRTEAHSIFSHKIFVL